MKSIINFLAKERTLKLLKGYNNLTFSDVRLVHTSSIANIISKINDNEIVVCDSIIEAENVLNDYLGFDICNDERIELIKIVNKCICIVNDSFVVLTDDAFYQYDNLSLTSLIVKYHGSVKSYWG